MLSRTLVMPLSDIGADQLADVGGKALNLAELAARRLPRPTRLLRHHPRLRARHRPGRAAPTPRRAGRHLRRDDPSLSRLAEPSPAWCWPPRSRTRSQRPSGRRTGGWARPSPVAVRSSATAEDLPFASFAGPAGHLPRRRRRRTRAGRGPPVLGVAVDRSRRRLPRHPGHRPRSGRASPSSSSRWCDAEVAGVLFTANPVTGPARRGRDRRQPRARRGGGVRRRQPRPLRRRHRDRRGPAAAARRQAARRSGRVPAAAPQRVTAAATGPACLTDAQLRELAALGRPGRAALRRTAGHRVGLRRRRAAVAHPVPPDHDAVPAARPARRRPGLRGSTSASASPRGSTGRSRRWAWRRSGCSASAWRTCSARPSADRRAGPPAVRRRRPAALRRPDRRAAQPGGPGADAQGARPSWRPGRR